MTDFIGMAVWLFDFLVLGMLPLTLVILVAVFSYKILKAARETTGAFLEEQFKGKEKQ
jgi:hypothetical protein